MTLNLNPAQLVLSGVCAMLLVVLGYLLFVPLPEISVPQMHARAETVEDDTPLSRFEAPPMAAFADIDDRSVFNPARVRVSSPSVAGATNATTLPSDISLVGVILDGEKRLALIKSPQAPLAVGLGVGGSIEGWQVTRVEADRVALRASGPEQELKLSDNKPTADSTTNGPNGGRALGPGNFRRPFPRQQGFQRPGMNNPGVNGPNNPNQNNPNNNNNNNNNNNDDDDDNNN
jgi:type II secretory pathway component PulC